MKKIVFFFIPLLLAACSSDDEQVTQGQEPEPSVVLDDVEYPPFYLTRLSEDGFMKVFANQTWTFCSAAFVVDEDGRWDRFDLAGNLGGELNATAEGVLEGTLYGSEADDAPHNVSYPFHYDAQSQTLCFPPKGTPGSFPQCDDTLNVISANEEYVVVTQYDKKRKRHYMYFLGSKGNERHLPLASNTTESLLPTERISVSKEEFLHTFQLFAWKHVQSYGIYADGTLGRWDGVDKNERYFCATDASTFKEYYLRDGKKVYRTCPFSYDEGEGCLVFQKDQMPTSFAGHSNKLYVLSLVNHYDSMAGIVLYEEAPPASGFKYILHPLVFGIKKEVSKWDKLYDTPDE